MNNPTPQGAFIALLALLGVLGQFGSNVFLPGLPQIATDYQVSANAASATYSVFLAVFGIGQLLAGPLTDRLGRRPMALHSTLLFTLASIACAMAPSLTALIIARVFQGLGAAGAIVASRTVARDSYEGPALVKVITVIMMAFALVPGLAPLLGGAFTAALGWRATLWACVLLGVVTWLWARSRLAETLRPETLGREGVFEAYALVLRNGRFVRMVLIAGIAFGGLLAFFGAAPRLYMLTLGVSPMEFGFYPPMALLGFFIGAILLRKTSDRHGIRTLLTAGVLVQLLACLVMLVPALAGGLNKWIVNAGFTLFVVGLGLLSPLASATAMNAQQTFVGQASALMGFMQMVAGAIGAALGNVLCNLLPDQGMQWSMLLLAVINLVLVRTLPKDEAVTSRPAT